MATPPAGGGRIVVVGGYGAVGRVAARALAGRFPGQVVVAGRTSTRAEALAAGSGGDLVPVRLDVTDPVELARVLEGTDVLLMCADRGNAAVARQCLARGIDCVDVSASDVVLTSIQGLDGLARATGATAVLSVGLAPGVTNLLARRCLDHLEDVASIDVTLLLGLGERHGEAALRWTLEELAAGPCRQRAARVHVPGHGSRTAHPLGFSDQHTLRHTLGVASVTTRLCLDSRLLTALVFGARDAGLLRPLRRPRVRGHLVRMLSRVHVGSDRFAVVVQAADAGGATASASFSGRGQSRATGLTAAAVVRLLRTRAVPAGVHHLHQVVPPAEFLASLATDVPDGELTSVDAHPFLTPPPVTMTGMAERDQHRHHAIDYIELTVPDLAAAKRFYADAFGWEFTDYGPQYAGIRDGSGAPEVGGLAVGAEVRTGGPLVLLYSADLDRTLTAVTSAGGRVVNGPYEFPGGRRFHFRDPGGNELGVWSEG